MENAIEAIKEFLFDIIGFLFPGMISLIIGKYIFLFHFSFDESQYIIAFITSYILGYFIFAISLMKELWIEKTSYWTWLPKKFKIITAKDIIEDLSGKETFKLASTIINEKTNSGNQPLINYNSLRNIAMSGSPDTDKKVYTFMFRAELFNQLHTISVISLLILIVHYIFCNVINFDLLPLKEINYYWIILFLFAVMSLRKGWKRFYKIAMSIPFSIYIEKNKK